MNRAKKIQQGEDVPDLPEEVEITMTNEMFYSISDVHFKHLASLGILKHIIGNKGKDLQVTINFSLGNSKVTLTFWANTINQPLR